RVADREQVAGAAEIVHILVFIGIGITVVPILDQRAKIVVGAGVGAAAAREEAAAAGAVDPQQAAADAHQLVDAADAPARAVGAVGRVDDHVGGATHQPVDRA